MATVICRSTIVDGEVPGTVVKTAVTRVTKWTFHSVTVCDIIVWAALVKCNPKKAPVSSMGTWSWWIAHWPVLFVYTLVWLLYMKYFNGAMGGAMYVYKVSSVRRSSFVSCSYSCTRAWCVSLYIWTVGAIVSVVHSTWVNTLQLYTSAYCFREQVRLIVNITLNWINGDYLLQRWKLVLSLPQS